MGLEPAAAFMLGIIVGQWLGVLMILKVVRAVLNRPSGASEDILEPTEQVALISRLIKRQLLGLPKPTSKAAKRAPLPEKNKTRRART